MSENINVSDSEPDSENEENKPNNVEIVGSSSESSFDDEEEEVQVQEATPKAVEISVDNLDKIETAMAASPQTPPAQPLPRRKRFIPKYEVEGVYKVVLGEETQAQVEMVIGSHINAQYPWKMVSKAKIIETIDIGKEISEFFHLKQYLEEYEDEEVLMGYIADESKDVDEFYICCTIESRDHCKQQSDKFIKRQEKKLEKAVQKKPRPWTSLGSEKEIFDVLPVNTRTLMELEVVAKFPTEYQPEKFVVRDTNSVRDGFIELTPYRQKFNNVFRKRVDCASQITPAKIDKAAQTQLRYPQNMWTQSIADALGKYEDKEGGGDTGDFNEFSNEEESSDEDEKPPKDAPDEVGLARYKFAMRRMRRPSYQRMINTFMKSKTDEMDSFIVLNTVMDMYCNDYPNLIKQKQVDDAYSTMLFEEYVCFTDVRAKDKYISCAEFHPMWSGIVAISYADASPAIMSYMSGGIDSIQRAVYGLNPVMIWSHIDSLHPKLYLESPREVKVLSFCPFNENILVGGCINGQIVLWDLTDKLANVEKIEVLTETREKYRIAMNSHMTWMKEVQDNAVVPSTVLSNLLTSHSGSVTALKWLSPNFIVSNTGLTKKVDEDQKKSLMLFSGSEDGTILIWNLWYENVTLFEGKKKKKSKRVTIRPPGLMVDLSPFKVLDRNLQPCYKIILGTAGQPQVLPILSLAMSEPPIKYIYTPVNTGTGRKYFKCEIIPQDESEIDTKLYTGTQHGVLARFTWEGHAFNTGEIVNSEYCETLYKCAIHDGLIISTQKNPFLPHITVTVGGKIFALWSDELPNRPLCWKKRPCRLTDVKWSLYKPSLLFVSTAEGDLEVWDLLLKSDKPISTQTLSGNMITGVSLHTLPLTKNIIGVMDDNGSFRMFLDPPIYMIEKEAHLGRMEAMLNRDLNVMKSFIKWQEDWMKNNPQILLEMKRKEGALLAENKEEKRRQREEEEKRLEEEVEARRLLQMRVIGPEERWQRIIQKLIERTIAVKKRINRAELIEHEKPLRELEAQRLEKERRMLEIMKNQQTIFNDTVAILFPEAIKKKEKTRKSLLASNKEKMKVEFLQDYEYLKKSATKLVKNNPYKVTFSWDATIAEGKERRQSLHAHEDYLKMHKLRIEEELMKPSSLEKMKKIEPDITELQDEELQDPSVFSVAMG